MQGINFVIDNKQQKVAVVIDLKKYGKQWEDFYDTLLAAQRKKEPRESLETFKAELLKQGKLKRA